MPALAVALTAKEKGRHRAGELLVRFRQGVAEERAESLVRSKGARRKAKLRGESRVERLEVAAGHDLEVLAEDLRRDPAVELVEPNFVVERAQALPDDPRLPEQWALSNVGQTGGAVGSDIGAPAAWATTTGAASTVVAVIDSGIDFTHPELRDNRWENRRERENGRDNDRNGFDDDLHG